MRRATFHNWRQEFKVSYLAHLKVSLEGLGVDNAEKLPRAQLATFGSCLRLSSGGKSLGEVGGLGMEAPIIHTCASNI